MAPEATLTVQDSATGIVDVLFKLTPKDNAVFYSVPFVKIILICSSMEQHTLIKTDNGKYLSKSLFRLCKFLDGIGVLGFSQSSFWLILSVISEKFVVCRRID